MAQADSKRTSPEDGVTSAVDPSLPFDERRLVGGENDYACCGAVRNGCCDASSPRAAASKPSAASSPPANPAIACTSWDVASSDAPMAPVGGSTARPPSDQSRPTWPR